MAGNEGIRKPTYFKMKGHGFEKSVQGIGGEGMEGAKSHLSRRDAGQ